MTLAEVESLRGIHLEMHASKKYDKDPNTSLHADRGAGEQIPSIGMSTEGVKGEFQIAEHDIQNF